MGASRVYKPHVLFPRPMSDYPMSDYRVAEGCRETPVSALRGHSMWVNSVALSTSGDVGLSTACDTTSAVWGVDSEGKLSLRGGEDFPAALSSTLSGDGKTCVVVGANGNCSVIDVQTSQLRSVLRGAARPLSLQSHAVSVSVDGRTAVVSGAHGTATCWDVHNNVVSHTLRGHRDSVSSVGISASGNIALTGSLDKTARIWDLRKATHVRILAGHSDAVRHVCLSASGSVVVTSSFDGTANVWDTCILKPTLTTRNPPYFGVTDAMSGDGLFCATLGSAETVRVWSTATGTTARVMRGSVRCVALNGDACMVLTGTADGHVNLWSVWC